MSGEFALIHALRAIATDPAARALSDDAAVLKIGEETLILTLDTIVEGVHYLPDDPPADVAWKLVAVNVSDLSAKGAKPIGCLYSHALGAEAWDQAFLFGLRDACEKFAIPLLGGDTVRMPASSARSFSLTGLGVNTKGCDVPCRTSARAGDRIWVSGTLGDATLGLQAAQGTLEGSEQHLAFVKSRYRRPNPSPELGLALAPLVHAMMDVSDGLLVDLARIAEASEVAVSVHAEAVPLSPAFRTILGVTKEDVTTAMTGGDDYELLFTAPAENTAKIQEAASAAGRRVTAIGTVSSGSGLSLTFKGQDMPLPERLGYQH